MDMSLPKAASQDGTGGTPAQTPSSGSDDALTSPMASSSSVLPTTTGVGDGERYADVNGSQLPPNYGGKTDNNVSPNGTSGTFTLQDNGVPTAGLASSSPRGTSADPMALQQQSVANSGHAQPLAQQTNPEGASATKRDFVQEHHGANNGSISSASRSRGGQSTRTSDLTSPGQSASSRDNARLEESVRSLAVLIGLGDKAPSDIIALVENDIRMHLTQRVHEQNVAYEDMLRQHEHDHMLRQHEHDHLLRRAEYEATVNASNYVSDRSPALVSSPLDANDFANIDTFSEQAGDQWGDDIEGQARLQQDVGRNMDNELTRESLSENNAGYTAPTHDPHAGSAEFETPQNISDDENGFNARQTAVPQTQNGTIGEVTELVNMFGRFGIDSDNSADAAPGGRGPRRRGLSSCRRAPIASASRP